MDRLHSMLELMVRRGAADLFLKTGSSPVMRIHGELRREIGPQGEVLASCDDGFMAVVLDTVLGRCARERFESDGEADAAYEVEGLGRFRINAFRQRGRLAFVFRYIPKKIPTFAQLNLPEAQLKKLCARRRGLVLVTGIAGSGKSTCLAAMVDYINSTSRRHIVTIEDPIEFVHEDKLSLIDQREIGLDTKSFSAALKHCVRQSPDVILIGEMRDRETMEAALNAAETGHLVLSTLHTVNAVQTVERIMGYFPPHLHTLVRTQLAMVLEGAISLRLLRRRDGPGMVPAVEMLLATPSVREMLQEGRTRELPAALRDGGYFGTQTFSQSLKRLVEKGVITEEDALAASDSPEDLRLEFKGIARGGELRMRPRPYGT